MAKPPPRAEFRGGFATNFSGRNVISWRRHEIRRARRGGAIRIFTRIRRSLPILARNCQRKRVCRITFPQGRILDRSRLCAVIWPQPPMTIVL
jgi:hypothetical protein